MESKNELIGVARYLKSPGAMTQPITRRLRRVTPKQLEDAWNEKRMLEKAICEGESWSFKRDSEVPDRISTPASNSIEEPPAFYLTPLEFSLMGFKKE